MGGYYGLYFCAQLLDAKSGYLIDMHSNTGAPHTGGRWIMSPMSRTNDNWTSQLANWSELASIWTSIIEACVSKSRIKSSCNTQRSISYSIATRLAGQCSFVVHCAAWHVSDLSYFQIYCRYYISLFTTPENLLGADVT